MTYYIHSSTYKSARLDLLHIFKNKLSYETLIVQIEQMKLERV